MKKAFEPAFDARRVAIATAIVAVLFSALIVRLYVLQVIKGEEYVAKGQSNFIQERRVPHARGLILDQVGRVLVDNRPSHNVYLTAAFLPDSTRSLQRLLAPTDAQPSEIADADQRVLAAVEETDDAVTVLESGEPTACTEIDKLVKSLDMRGVLIERDPALGTFGDDAPCRVVVVAREFPSRAAVFRRVRELVGLSEDQMKQHVDSALGKSRGLGKFKPALLLEDVGFEAYARLEAAASLGDLPGIDVVDSQKRRYRHGSLGAHVLGYMNELTPAEYEDKKDDGYYLGDLMGRRGIEATHEADLRGRDGLMPVVVDAKGRDKGGKFAEELLGPERGQPPTPGKTLLLSIDEDMQRTAESAFNGLAGSVVAMEVNTGFILAMASFPTYDPNLVVGPWSKRYVRELTSDKLRPWTNKAIQEHYAPGSTFKAITAAAGLRYKLIDEHQQRACPGFFRLGRSTWRCFNRTGHGGTALVRALQYSCDSYFYSLGYDLGPDRLADGARLFGFGSRTGLDLDRETPGVMPDRAYYVRRFGAYSPGFVVNNSIGQGDVTVTPLQLAVAYAAIANGGTVYKPQIVRDVRDPLGNVLETHEPVVVARLGLDEHIMALMKESLAHVTDPGGTASGLLWRKDRYADMSSWLRESGITIVGKTGTAQVVKLAKNVAHVEAKDVPYAQRDHAWFVGFAPYDKPEIVVVTMTEHGGFGGSTSGPVTAEVLRTWFTTVRGTGRYEALGTMPTSGREKSPKPGASAPVKPEPNEEEQRVSREPEIDSKLPADDGSSSNAPLPQSRANDTTGASATAAQPKPPSGRGH